MTANEDQDKARIIEIIAQMFDAISWTEDTPPDLVRFRAFIAPEAVLVPAARPAVPTDIGAFVDRMGSLHRNQALKTFQETADQTTVKLFGNIAVAMGSFTAVADGNGSRGVNGFLFVKDGDWKIVGLAWDNERDDNPIPTDLD